MIFTGFFSNAQKKDVFIAMSYIFLPWNWSKICVGNKMGLLEKAVGQFFSVQHVTAFDSGRTALYAILRACNIKSGDLVMVQAFTCVVVVNAIKELGAQPLFVDITTGGNMDVEDVKKKYRPDVKAIVIQHTFGVAAEVEPLVNFAKKKKIYAIEDCAHTFGGKHNDKFLGMFGDASFFSFGSDKPISCGRGGVTITRDTLIGTKIREYQQSLSLPSVYFIFKYLLQYVYFPLGKMCYGLYIGKVLLFLLKKCSIAPRVITEQEKQGNILKSFHAQLANSLSHIALQQLSGVVRTNNHRRWVVSQYRSLLAGVSGISFPQVLSPGDIPLRYLLLVENSKEIIFLAKKKGIILGDWYTSVIGPDDVSMASTGYLPASCPRAESFTKKVINLPTHQSIGKKEIEVIVLTLKNTI